MTTVYPAGASVPYAQTQVPPMQTQVPPKDQARMLLPMGEFISDNGLVDYNALMRNETSLKHNLEVISKGEPSRMSTKERMAFYMNTYNILCINTALDEIKKKSSWQGNKSLLSRMRFFSKRYTVAGETMSLNHIERDIISKFDEPRIHCCVNCASMASPGLRRDLFEADKLDEQMEERTRHFINQQKGVLVEDGGNVLHLSPIFKWHKSTFEKKTTTKEGVVPFIRRYWQSSSGVSIAEKPSIKYDKFDWSINDTKLPSSARLASPV